MGQTEHLSLSLSRTCDACSRGERMKKKKKVFGLKFDYKVDFVTTNFHIGLTGSERIEWCAALIFQAENCRQIAHSQKEKKNENRFFFSLYKIQFVLQI